MAGLLKRWTIRGGRALAAAIENIFVPEDGIAPKGAGSKAGKQIPSMPESSSQGGTGSFS